MLPCASQRDVGRPAERVRLVGAGWRPARPSRRARRPVPAGGRAPSRRGPAGLNLMTMFDPSSTAQMLSSLSTRTACANSKP